MSSKYYQIVVISPITGLDIPSLKMNAKFENYFIVSMDMLVNLFHKNNQTSITQHPPGGCHGNQAFTIYGIKFIFFTTTGSGKYTFFCIK